MITTTRLRDQPDWAYLLHDIYRFYRYRSAGGSDRIRSHQRQVRERLRRAMDANPELVLREPGTKPVCVHLNRALDEGGAGPADSVIRVIRNIRGSLLWQYGYDKMPTGLTAKYAYAELAGPEGPVRCEDLVLGLVLFAPGCVYPTHIHEDLEESYICLSGTISENDAGVYAPGSLIYNSPGRSHRITNGTFEPSLLLYAWVGSRQALMNPNMVFVRLAKAR